MLAGIGPERRAWQIVLSQKRATSSSSGEQVLRYVEATMEALVNFQFHFDFKFEVQ